MERRCPSCAARTAATGEDKGYYAEYLGDTKKLGRALAEGFAFQGEMMEYRGGPRGEPSAGLPPTAFIAFIQNHDQVGNRAFGERINAIAKPEAVRAIAAVYLLLPQVPMLFMGEEWAASQPFPFFCDFGGELADAVRKGRRKEFAKFPEFKDEKIRERIPDPQAEATFASAKLAGTRRPRSPMPAGSNGIAACSATRRAEIVPRLAAIGGNAARFETHRRGGGARALAPRRPRGAGPGGKSLGNAAGRLPRRVWPHPLAGRRRQRRSASVPGRCAGRLTTDDGGAAGGPGNPACRNAAPSKQKDSDMPPVIPRATYRLQFHKGFGFDRATELAPYLARLGVSHLYASSYLKARPGSTHGYDIVDHDALNPELGDEASFNRMNAALAGTGSSRCWISCRTIWGSAAPTIRSGSTCWNGAPIRLMLDGSTSTGTPTAATSATSSSFPCSATSTAPCSRRESSPSNSTSRKAASRSGPTTPTSCRSARCTTRASSATRIPSWSGSAMPSRASPNGGRRSDGAPARLKAELAALCRERADVRDAVAAAVGRLNGEPGRLDSWRGLDALIQEQYWRAAHFRVAADDINYRRFFNINELAGLRMELPEVFDHAHRLVFRLLKSGVLDGLRIDHIDGLLDPKGYLNRLREKAGNDFYLVVEKILAPHESLREDWPVQGTTGYDFTNLVLALLVDPAGEESFNSLYTGLTGHREPFADIVHDCKLRIMRNEMASELNVLARDAARVARQNPRTTDFTRNLLHRAIREIVACFPVYRTYVDAAGECTADDKRDLDWAIARARRNETEIDPSVFDFLARLFSGELVEKPRSGFSRHAVLRLRDEAAAI